MNITWESASLPVIKGNTKKHAWNWAAVKN